MKAPSESLPPRRWSCMPEDRIRLQLVDPVVELCQLLLLNLHRGDDQALELPDARLQLDEILSLGLGRGEHQAGVAVEIDRAVRPVDSVDAADILENEAEVRVALARLAVVSEMRQPDAERLVGELFDLRSREIPDVVLRGASRHRVAASIGIRPRAGERTGQRAERNRGGDRGDQFARTIHA